MKASTERKLIRWAHIILSIPIIGYVYGRFPDVEPAVASVRLFFLPAVILLGVWMWLGSRIKRKVRKKGVLKKK